MTSATTHVTFEQDIILNRQRRQPMRSRPARRHVTYRVHAWAWGTTTTSHSNSQHDMRGKSPTNQRLSGGLSVFFPKHTHTRLYLVNGSNSESVPSEAPLKRTLVQVDRRADLHNCSAVAVPRSDYSGASEWFKAHGGTVLGPRFLCDDPQKCRN